MFVSFEGPEGSGKSLQARGLEARLREAGVATVVTREPGGTRVGDQLRELLLTRGDLPMRPRAQALVLCASRAELVEEVIRPALAAGRVVVCDRYADSTLAYQGYGHGLELDALRAVLRFATDGIGPTLTILLDLPAREGLERKRRQSVASAEEWNRFEAEELAFHERVRAGYHALAAEEPGRWRTFDARKPPNELAEEIWALVRGCLARHSYVPQ